VRTLSATLQAAVKGYDLEPAVSVLVSDNPPEAPRLSGLASVYSGVEGDVIFDACWTGTGQIARCYLSGSNVYAQVVTPGVGAAWSTWALVSSTAWNPGGSVPIALRGNAAGVTLYWVKNDSVTIQRSSWSGSAWGAATTVLAVVNAIGGLAADGADPTERLFYACEDAEIYETHWTGSAFSAGVALGGIHLAVTIGAGYDPVDGTSKVMMCYGSVSEIQVAVFSPSTGWGAVSTVWQTSSTANYTYENARISAPIGTAGRWVLTWSEVPPSPGVVYPFVAFTPQYDQLCGAVPWQNAGTKGVRVFRDGFASPSWWFITANGVWSCPADTADYATGQRVSFAQDQIYGLDLDERTIQHPGKALITVLNTAGYLSTAGQSGAYLALRPWSQVVVNLGYHTVAGDERVYQSPWWVTAVIFHDEVGTGVPLVTFECTDAWGMLEEMVYRSAVTYAGVTADRLARGMWWHVSGDLVTASPAALTGLTPTTFLVRAGEALALILRRIADLAGVVFTFGTFLTSVDGSGWDSVSCRASVYGLLANGVVWTFGGSGQPVVQSEIAVTTIPSATGALVAGKTTVSTSRNWDEIGLAWRDHLARLTDKTLTTQALTDSAAANLAGLIEGEQRGGHLVCYANPGLEVGDVVEVTIPTSPLNATPFVVSGLRTVWQRESGRYFQTVYLEGTH